MTSRSATVSFSPPGTGSMYFDGNGDYLTAPSSTDLNLTSGDFTIECWVYPITTAGVILDKDGVYSVSYPQFQLAFGSNSKFGAYLGNGAGVSPSGTPFTGATVCALNTWHHVALVVSGTAVSLYVNGILDATGTKPAMYEGGKTLLIGGNNIGTAGVSYFNGYIDDLRITKGTARYTSNFTVPSEPFSENTTIDPYYNNVSLLLHGDGVNTSTNFIDSSPTPKTISAFGNAQISTAQSKFTSSAGISGYVVTSTPGGITATGVSSPIAVNGLDNGTEYTFNVKAISGGTNGPVSAQSNKVIPIDIDPYYSSVSLLLHGDGTNGSTSFVDSSSLPKSVTSVGSAQISTTKSKFGGSSMYFNGSNYATIPTNAAFDFGTSDFTLEAFVNLPTISGTKIIIGRQEPSNGMALQLWISNNTAGVTLRTQGGGTVYSVASAAVLTTDTWTHIAGVRYGSLLYIFINGALSGSITIPVITLNCSRPLTIGVLDDTTLAAYYTGYIDDLRITKGVARYTANFAVPTAPFANSRPSYDPYFSKVSLLLHGDGANNSTSIVDSSPNSKIMSAFGNAKISTSQSKFGSSSMYFDGSGDYFTTSTSTDFALGYVWTLEAWIRPAAYNGVIFDVRTASQCGYWHLDANGKIAVPGGPYSSPTVTHISTAVIALNSWTHVAVCGSLTGTAIFINGVLDSISSTVSNWATTTQKPYIGIAFDTTSYPFNGYIAGLRITKGVARYTSNFTVPVNQLPDYLPPPDANYSKVALLLHGEGVDGTNQFTDSSPLPGTLTAVGNITHTTTTKRMGASSINIPNNTSKINVVKSSAVDLTGTYTIEFWARTSTVSVGDYNAIISTNDNVYPNRFVIDFGTPSSTTIVGRVVTPSNGIVYTSPTQPYVLGDWAHFAFVNNSTANTHTVFINGVVAGSRAAVPLFNATTFQVGKNSTFWAEGPYQIDDLRITNGVVKYPAAFLPPTLEDTYFEPSFSSVSLLLHGNGANGSTSIVDSGSNTKLVTVNGGAQISTTQSKFGGSSMYFDGASDSLTIPDSSDLNFGNFNFTFECWCYPTSFANHGGLFSKRISEQPTESLTGYITQSTGTVAFTATGSNSVWEVNMTSSAALGLNVWNHIVVARSSSSWMIFINGTLSATVTSTISITSNSNPLTIGATGANSAFSFNGYLDELRITKGVARYTSNFTVPTAPFPDQ